MKDKAKEEDFVPVLQVGLFRGNPAVRTLDYEDNLRATQIAGFMTAILDCMVDMVDEQDQLEFEENILDAFELFVKDRYDHTNKYKLGEE
jgi:hypothetical protein